MNKLCLIALLMFSLPTFARKIGRVTEFKGMSFLQKPDGETIQVYKDIEMEVSDMIFIADNSHLKLVDFYDREFIFSEGSEFLFRNDMIELRKGHVWVTSSRDESFIITTANSSIVFANFEGIVSFNDDNSRTDISVNQGNAYFNNIDLEEVVVDVGQGQFSYIQKKYNGGVPRAATILGGESFNKLTKLFDSEPQNKIIVESKVERSIASVDDSEQDILQDMDKGKLIIIKEPSRKIASIKEKVRVVKPKKKMVSRAPVRFFGIKKPSITQPITRGIGKTRPRRIVKKDIRFVKPMRAPSSIPKARIAEDPFEQSLNKHFNQQKRHPSERLELIDELRSVSEDFQKEY